MLPVPPGRNESNAARTRKILVLCMGLTMVYESVLLNRRWHLGETLHRWVRNIPVTWVLCLVEAGFAHGGAVEFDPGRMFVCSITMPTQVSMCKDNQTAKILFATLCKRFSMIWECGRG